jgi:hypothetical protein
MKKTKQDFQVEERELEKAGSINALTGQGFGVDGWDKTKEDSKRLDLLLGNKPSAHNLAKKFKI